MDTANHYSSHTDYTFAALADAFNHATLRQQREMGTALLRIFEPLSYHHGTATVADRPMKLHFAMQAPVFMDLFTQGKLHLLQPDTVTRAFVDVTYDRHTAEPVAFQAQVFDFLSVNPNIPNPDQALFQTSFLVFDGEDEDYPFGKCDYTSRPVVKSPKEIQEMVVV